MHEQFNASVWLVDRNIEAGNGDRVAVITGDRSYTYHDVHRAVLETAAALRAIGVRPEERVALAMLDSIEFAAAFLGAMRIGAVPVAMNPLLPGRDLGVIVADSRARLAMVSGPVADRLPELTAGAPELEQVVITADDSPVDPADSAPGSADSAYSADDAVDPRPIDDRPGPTRLSWEAFVASTAGPDVEIGAEPYDTWFESPGFWLCTSGSTGQPKLAIHRHGDIKVTCDTYASTVLGIGENDRFFSVGPMFHAYGLGNSLTFPFSVGATTILEPTRPPTPQLVAGLVATHRPTLFFCIPTFYAALNNSDLADDTFESVRYGVSAAEPLPAETFERFKQRFGVTILDGIGSTELLHIYLSNAPGATRAGTSG
ncbi:MAG: AMP-binding protein, partial [Acidimicrobiales bacterium]